MIHSKNEIIDKHRAKISPISEAFERREQTLNYFESFFNYFLLNYFVLNHFAKLINELIKRHPCDKVEAIRLF